MNSRAGLLLGLGLTIAGIALGAVISSSLSQPSPASRTFDFTYVVRVPKLPTDAKTLRLWVPLPQSNQYQNISDLKIDSPVRYTRHREPEYDNEYVSLDASVAQVRQPFEVQVRFRATRHEHRVVLDQAGDPPPAAAAPKAELARFLQPDRLIPLNGVIADLSRQETQGLTDPLVKARKIYEYVIATMRYDKSGTGWGHGDAIWACTAKYGNCTDFHSLFIGMARAAGIPARFEIGFPLPDSQHEGAVSGYHCWAEFYVQPYGWIPVDTSEAWKHPEKHDYFFGAHDVNRVQFTMGRDIRLDPAPRGDPINYFIYPYAELDGKAYTALEYKFSFRDIATPSRAKVH